MPPGSVFMEQLRNVPYIIGRGSSHEPRSFRHPLRPAKEQEGLTKLLASDD